MEKEISNIYLNKATAKNAIAPKILKVSCSTSAETMQNLFSECLITYNFPDDLKLEDITPVLKKKDPLINENYRPANVMHSISKIFEKLVNKYYINKYKYYINSLLSPSLCSYRRESFYYTASIIFIN